ncbi:hypothetical protein BpHYR1_032120 [Brachionus plicatilis]|uniref:Uncharacterized protein n=1 Tax=Brachionus plicatilis TaxID=10195 RepID=A0A3M7PJH2_BRAPC|nr:hypothetical protein BpHYR1_032120 [Brachionus plicatilis]
MDLNSPVSNADDLVVLVDALCQKFSANKPAGRSGNPHAREVDLVAVIRSLDGAYRRCMVVCYWPLLRLECSRHNFGSELSKLSVLKRKINFFYN